MSHANGQCRFDSDGLVLHFEYDGRSDVVISALWRTYAEMSAHWREGIERSCTCGRDEPVQLANDYANGESWPGRACRHCLAVTDGLECIECDVKDGEPDWWENG